MQQAESGCDADADASLAQRNVTRPAVEYDEEDNTESYLTLAAAHRRRALGGQRQGLPLCVPTEKVDRVLTTLLSHSCNALCLGEYKRPHCGSEMALPCSSVPISTPSSLLLRVYKCVSEWPRLGWAARMRVR